MPTEPLAAIMADPDWEKLSPEDKAEVRLKYAQKIAKSKAESGTVAKAVDKALDFAGGVAKRLMPFPGLFQAIDAPETLPRRDTLGVQQPLPPPKNEFTRPPPELPSGVPPTSFIINPNLAESLEQNYPISYVANPKMPARKTTIDVGHLLNPVPTGAQEAFRDLTGTIRQYSPEAANLVEAGPMAAVGMGPVYTSGMRGVENLGLYRRSNIRPEPEVLGREPQARLPVGREIIEEATISRPGGLPSAPTRALESPAKLSADFFERAAAEEAAFRKSPQQARLLRAQLQQQQDLVTTAVPDTVAPVVPPARAAAIAKGKARVTATQPVVISAKEPAAVSAEVIQRGQDFLETQEQKPPVAMPTIEDMVRSTSGPLESVTEEIALRPEAPPILTAPEVVDKIASASEGQPTFDKPKIEKEVEKADTYQLTEVDPNDLKIRSGIDPLWAGTVDAKTGAVTSRYTKAQAKEADWHHQMYMSPEDLNAIHSGERVLFYMGEEGKPAFMTQDRDLTPQENEFYSSAFDKGPIVTDDKGKVIDGNHRAEDAKAAGETVQAYVPAPSRPVISYFKNPIATQARAWLTEANSTDRLAPSQIKLGNEHLAGLDKVLSEARIGGDADNFSRLRRIVAERLEKEVRVYEPEPTSTVAPGSTILAPAIPEAQPLSQPSLGDKPLSVEPRNEPPDVYDYIDSGRKPPNMGIGDAVPDTGEPPGPLFDVAPAESDISMSIAAEPPIDTPQASTQIESEENVSGPTSTNPTELADGQRTGEDTGVVPERENVGPGGPIVEGPPASGPVYQEPGIPGVEPVGSGGQGGGIDIGAVEPGLPGETAYPPEGPTADIQPPGSSGGGYSPKLAAESDINLPEELIPVSLPQPNYSLPKDRDWIPSGQRGRVDANVAAVQILNELERTGRAPSPEEQDALSKYVGWGGLKPVFDVGKAAYRDNPPRYDFQREEWQNWEKSWGKQYDQVRAGLTPDEYRSAKNSLDTQHYTSRVVINKIWAAIERLGFRGGKALEPAVGVGNFIGLTPDSLKDTTHWHGIDVDSVAGRIARVLYPQAKIDISPYEKANVPPNSKDLVISNVPFSDIGVEDPRFPNLNLHNYYFVRSLDAVKPGGIVAFITSAYTMDAPAGVKARQAIAEKADLIGAIRLPNNAFEGNANTEVTTDVIFLRKKDGTSFPSERWDKIEGTETYDKRPININEYYVNHPEMLMGRLSLEGTMYAKDQSALLPIAGKSLETQMGEAIQKLPQDVFGKQELTPIDLSQEEKGPVRGKPGNYVVQDGKVVKVGSEGQALTPVWADKGPGRVQQAEHFIGLREARNRQVNMEVNPNFSDEEIEAGRRELVRQYNAYVKKYGNINGLKSKFLQDDIEFVSAGSLERPIYSFRTIANGRQVRKTDWAPSDILTKRTGFPRVAPSSVDNIPDAAEVSFNFKGAADPEYISQLTSIPVEQVIPYLEQNGIAFQSPQDGLWYSGPEYLSGMVRKKLEAAQAAAAGDPRYLSHIAELEKVQPKRVPIHQASITLGADWIPPETVAQWGKEILQDRNFRVTYTPVTATWHVEEGGGSSSANAVTWGVENPSGISLTGADIIGDALNGRPAIVWDTWRDEHGDTKRARNDTLTIDARAKQARLKKEFSQWAKTTEGVSAQLEDLYNDRQNFAVLPQYKPPSWKYYPGASVDIVLRDDQKTAVTRGLKNSLGLFHAPGNGKTFIMTTIGMEARRLGIAKKPMIVVHNSTAEQFPSMAQALYPNAKIMSTGMQDFDPQHRRSTMARIATGDWDLVIIPQSQYDMIGIQPERVQRWIDDQLDELERSRIEMARVEGENSPQVRDIVRAQRRMRKELDELANIRTDDAYNFEDLGIDMLMVDEFHNYKKLAFVSNRPSIKGLDRTFSKRGFANKLKMMWVQEHANGKNTLGATGTPISNTSAEAWNMMRYLRPDVIKEYGMEMFDQFASTFGDTKTEIELTAGGSWKEDTRFTGYTNAQSLVKAWKETGDVVTQDMVKLKDLPVIKGGATKSVEVEQTPELTAAIRWIRSQLEGYARVTGKQRRELNWIPGTMYTMGKKASIDMRLIDPSLPDNPDSKLNHAVREVQRMYKEYDDIKGVTWVFLDMQNDQAGSNATFNTHEEIRRKLIRGGIPANEVVIMDQKVKGAKRAAVRQQVNEGKIRVLIGHTSTMGTGFDAPKSSTGLIHVDTPDTPAQMEQRTARAVRQGNQNGNKTPEGISQVELISLGVRDSLDGARYQMMVRKQAQLNQLMRGEFQGNYVEDPTDDVFLDFQQQLAAYSGNPLAYARFKLENEIKSLEAIESAHAEQVMRSQRQLLELRDKQIPFNERQLDAARAAAEEFTGVFDKGYTPVLTINGNTYTGEKDVKAAMELWSRDVIEKAESDARLKKGSIRRENPDEIFLNGKRIVSDADVAVTTDVDSYDAKKGFTNYNADGRIVWRFKDGPNSYNGFTTGSGFLQNVPAQVGLIMREPEIQEVELASKVRNGLELKNFIEGPSETGAQLQEKRTQLVDVVTQLQAQSDPINVGDTVMFQYGNDANEGSQGAVREIGNGQAVIEPTDEDWITDHGMQPGQTLTVPTVNLKVPSKDPDYPLATHPPEQRVSIREAIREALGVAEADPMVHSLRKSMYTALEGGDIPRANELRGLIRQKINER